MPSTEMPAILVALAVNGYSMRRTAKVLLITLDEARARFSQATGLSFKEWRREQERRSAPIPTKKKASVQPSAMDIIQQLAIAISKPLESIAIAAAARAAVPQVFDAEPLCEIPPAPVAGGSIEAPETKITSRPGRRFVMTCAQNNTHVHQGLMAALERFCAHKGAELLVSLFAYNTKGWRQPEKDGNANEECWYDPAVRPYVCDNPVRLAHDLIFCAEQNISPTAVDPMSGMYGYSKSSSAIFPHVKVHMKSLATMKSEPARMIYTTGTVTQMNYIARKAGLKAAFHHVYVAIYVEVSENGTWFARQLVATDDGSFQDLDLLYSADGIQKADIECITWGDFHEEKRDQEVHDACFGPGGMLDTLKPRQQHVHDAADFRARNHHNIKDPYFLAQCRFTNSDRVDANIGMVASKLDMIEREWCRSIIIESNHDQALRKWLCEADGHKDPANARYWHYWNYRIYDAIEKGNDLFVFEEAVRSASSTGLKNTTFLREDQSWVICGNGGNGIECGLHGHRGPNGSRGSPKSYRQLGSRVNSGHTHSAGIIDGVYTAGVSGTLDMTYNVGPSSWSHSHILTYSNGKRAIVTMINGKWRDENG